MLTVNSSGVVPENFMKIILIVGSEIYKRRIARYFLKFLFIFYTILFLIHVYFSLADPSMDGLINSVSLIFKMIYDLLAIGVLLFKDDILTGVFRQVVICDFSSAGPQTEKRIFRQSETISKFVVVNLILSLIWIFCFIYPDDAFDQKYIFVYRIFNRFCPKYSRLLGLLFKMTFGFSCIIMQAHPYQFLYYTGVLAFQVHLLNQVIENISDKGGVDDSSLLEDDCYQSQIKCKLRTIARQHQNLINYKNVINTTINNLIIPFNSGAVCIGIGLGLSFLELMDNINVLIILRTTLFAFIALLSILVVFAIGQELENEVKICYTFSIRQRTGLESV